MFEVTEAYYRLILLLANRQKTLHLANNTEIYILIYCKYSYRFINVQ